MQTGTSCVGKAVFSIEEGSRTLEGSLPNCDRVRRQSNDILPIRKVHKLYFFKRRSFFGAAIPRYLEKTIMDRETNELIELGSVTTDTAGDNTLGIEGAGKFKVTGLTQD